MKEEIYKICTKLNDGQIAVVEAQEQLLLLFDISEQSGQLPNNLILYRQAKKLDYAEFCKWINAKLGNLR